MRIDMQNAMAVNPHMGEQMLKDPGMFTALSISGKKLNLLFYLT